MPELPEVEIVRRGLLLRLPGRKIEKIKLFPGHTVRHPPARKFCTQIIGCKFATIDRRGKYLLFRLSDEKNLVIHLGMSGRLLLRHRKDEPLTHVRMSIDLAGTYHGVAGGRRGEAADGDAGAEADTLLLQDPRRFSRVWLVEKPADIDTVVPSLKELGVEPLSSDLNEQYLHRQLVARKQNIKAVLLDQTVVAGIGNIYADESLFAARIHPLTSSKLLTKKQRLHLIDSIREVLTWAIESGGSTLRNYSDSAGVNGTYQNRTWVYARDGQPCRICGTLIRKTVVMARSTHFCPRCQHAKKSAIYKSHSRR